MATEKVPQRAGGPAAKCRCGLQALHKDLDLTPRKPWPDDAHTRALDLIARVSRDVARSLGCRGYLGPHKR